MRFVCEIALACFLFISSVKCQVGEGLECFCLPPNQVCDPTLVTPRNAIKIEKVDTRILNTNPEALCQQQRSPCCFASSGGSQRDPGSTFPGSAGRIVDCGTNTALFRRQLPGQADMGEYPWMAVLTDPQNNFIGTGALISPFHVVTTAHKIPQGFHNLVIRLGDYDLLKENELPGFPHESIGVANVIIHPQYNREKVSNNIAIIVLNRPVNYRPHIRSVCLPAQGQIFDGQRCYVSGWGKKGAGGDFQPIMKEVDLPIVDTLQCESLLRQTALSRHFILDKTSFICAGGEVGKDACEGDGGAPLVCSERGNAVVVGLVAWGVSCGTNIPGVYVNVANYKSWIDSIIHG